MFVFGTGRRKLLATMMLLVGFYSPAGAQTVQPLAELLQLAEMRHSDFLVEKTSYEIIKEDIPIARAALLPQASASLSQQQGDNSGVGWSAGVSISQRLYDLGQWRLWQAAGARVKGEEMRLAAARQNLRRDVILAWLDVQLAIETLRLLDARRKTLQAQLERTEVLAASGEGIEADVLAARAQLANAQSEWEQAKHNLAVTKSVILRYTDAAAAELQLALQAALPRLPPLLQWQQQVEEDNLSLKALRRQTDSVRHRLQAASASFQPRLSLVGSYIAQDGLDNVTDSWRLSLEQTLFAGGSLRAHQRQLIAESDNAHAQVMALLSQHDQTLKRLHGQMQADLARMQALGEAEVAAAAFLEVIIVGYENGVRVITDVLSAEEDLFNAQINLRQAAYGYLRNLTTVQALLAASDDAFAARIEQLFLAAEKL